VYQETENCEEFYKSAESQLGLLKTIGVTQMEKELLKEYKPILDRSKFMEKYVEQPLEQLQVKEIIRDVLQELQLREGDNTKDKSK
jgi:arginine deiminase